MSKSKLLYKVYIIGFVLLYICTALISFFHAREFFDIGNESWMSTTLAAVFELGQMIVLSSLLLSNNKKTTVPWILLSILTFVQVVGNVFSVYKHISISNSNDYVYLQKSMIDWWLSGVQQETIVVIISWITGALLPIIALFMTSMVANNIQLMNEEDVKSPVLNDSNGEEHKTIDNTEKDSENEEKASNIMDKIRGSADSLKEEFGY